MLNLNTSEFLGQVQRINAGGNGFKKQVWIPPGAWVASGGAHMSSNIAVTGPTFVSTSQSAFLTLSVPLDYDPEKGELSLVMLCERDVGTDSHGIRVTTSAAVYRAGAATATPWSAAEVRSTLVVDSTALVPKMITVVLSGRGFKKDIQPGDVVYLPVSIWYSTTNGTDTITTRGAWIEYASTLVAFDPASR